MERGGRAPPAVPRGGTNVRRDAGPPLEKSARDKATARCDSDDPFGGGGSVPQGSATQAANSSARFRIDPLGQFVQSLKSGLATIIHHEAIESGLKMLTGEESVLETCRREVLARRPVFLLGREYYWILLFESTRLLRLPQTQLNNFLV